MNLGYFISSHGYGHGVRSAVIINTLPADWNIHVFSTLPQDFFSHEIKRPFRHIQWELDCGCVQKNSLEVDITSTLRTYEKIEANREELLGKTISMLREFQIEAVVADIPPLAFSAASRLQLPSVGVSNFNWVDIYEGYLSSHPGFRPLIEKIKADYRLAVRHLVLYPFLASGNWLRREQVGIVARSGENRRAFLAESFDLNPDKKWGLIYVGHYGMSDMEWDRLEHLSEWEFMGLYDLPQAPSNYRRIEVGPNLGYAYITASADVVVGKLGYGVVAECLSLAKPVLFVGREDFAEYSCLREALSSRGQGMEVTLNAFRKAEFGAELERLAQYKPNNIPENGLERVKSVIIEVCSSRDTRS